MQTGLIAFDIIAKINGISIDLRSIIREYSLNEDEIEISELLRILKQFEFKAKIKIMQPEEIEKAYPLPAVIINRDNSYSVLLKINSEEKRVLIFSIKENNNFE